MLFKDGLTKQRSVFFICFLFTAILICSPWYIYFYRIYGTILPLWIKPSHELANTFPFIKTVITRPWHFYISRIVLIAPIYLFAFLNILYLLKKKQIRPEIIWALSFIIPFSILGINGCGYQTRFIAPAIPALAMLSANVFDLENEWIGVLGILLLALGMLTGILNSLISNPSEVIPFYIFFNK